jgi:hypothetical protein
MRRARATLVAALLCLTTAALAPAPAAAEAPAWTITLTPLPANFAPGQPGEYLAVATNVGGAPTTGEATKLEVLLPAQIKPLAATSTSMSCAPIVSQAVKCETTTALPPSRLLLVKVKAEATGPTGTYDAVAHVRGGGTGQEASATMPTPVQAEPIPFGFLAGFAAPVNGADGSAAVLAGSHPYQQTVAFGFPTKEPGDGLTNDGHPRDFYTELPPGLIGSPAATPVLCTEVQLTGKGCPDASQVGVTDVTTLFGGTGLNAVFTSGFYNMVPPPGVAAELGTEVAGAGVYVHVLASVRSGDQYRVQGAVRDVIAFGTQPIFNVQAQLWGDPSAAIHDEIRGACVKTPGSACTLPVRSEVPFLTMPGSCPGQPLSYEVLADSWEEPSPPAELLEARYEGADLEGQPKTLEGCGELEFEPTIQARPTTTLADSPAGLDFDLEQPQEKPREKPLEGRATAILKDATIAFPAGLAVNASQAAGLGACSEGQVGFEGKQEGALRFGEEPQSCPAAAKIGTLTATSPLLVQRDPVTHEVQIDPKTATPALEPLHGSLYLAAPFANPFGSLVAVYLVIEDEQTGIVAKLAGEGQLDPVTGQITTRFTENPQVPVEDIHVHVFGGDRGAFVTPPGCGTYTTEAELVPWSAPEGAPANPKDSFEVNGAPGGGPCPAAQPNTPALSAGTLEPAAGKYSPMVFKLTRPDGSARLARIEATLPPGLTAKLAGVARCSDADLAKAISREAPNRGAAELADPSCPAASEVGTANVGAGAGPTPYYTQGRAYLAGPYKGAPLSFAIITPAVAGPFDLGTVVVRAAVYVDPETAQPRTVSDPLPQIIDGIPVDVRSVALRLARPSTA